jgi:Tol biopolymer transport system component
MAPEQASGLPADRRADVWSFGVVLFEMLTGTQMFTGHTTAHILAGVLRADPPWDALPGNLHPRIRLMLERCLEKDPRNRYHDIADVRVDLERVLADPAGALAAPAPVAVAERRSMLPFVGAAVLAVVAASAATWFLKPAEQPQVVRFDYELPDGLTFWNPGFPAVALSPDGRRVAYNTSAGIYVMSLDQLEGRLIPGTEVTLLSASNVMFSRDGEWIGYLSTVAGQLQKVSVNGGAPVPLASLTSDFGGASWGADDQIVFAEGQAITRVSGNGGAPEVLFEVTDGAPTLPRMLPDGRTVAYCVNLGAESPQVMVRGLGEDEVRTSLAGCGADYLPSGHLVYAAVNGTLFVQPFDLGARAVGGGPVSLVEGVMNVGIPQFSASPSGSLAYLPGGVEVAQDRRLGVVDLEGGVELLEGIPPGPYSSPRVSPDGTSVAFQSTEAAPLTAATSTVLVYDLSGDTAVRRLATGGKNFHPIWTPDSRNVTFASDREGAAGIYVQPADGSSPPERLTTVEGSLEHWPDAWSPDGETLVYSVVSSGRNDTDLWMLSREEPEHAAVFVEGMNHQHDAVFSPDGRWIAYASDEGTSLTDQIYVQPFPTTGATYQITSESGGYPVWTADGGSLSYRRNTTATTGETAPGLFRVEIVAGERFAWRNERRLPFEGFLIFAGMRDYDVLPDGRFVMLFPAESRATGDAQRPRINLVLDWLEEVKTRVATN